MSQASLSTFDFRNSFPARSPRLIIPEDLPKTLDLVRLFLLNSFRLSSSCLLTTLAGGASSSETSLLSPEAHTVIRSIAAGSPVQNPSLQALTTHLADLEQELRDEDFRLQFLYRQRLATLELINTARSRVEKYKA